MPPPDSARYTVAFSAAVCVVCAVLVAVLVASTVRRPLVGAWVVAVAVGWPATLLEGEHAYAVGAAGLAAALWQPLVHREASVRRLAAGVALVGGLVAASAAIAAAGSSPDAQIAWRGWNPFGGGGVRVGVSYVWDANYAGVRFPARPTVVLKVRAPRRSFYWRASTLDLFTGDRWVESLYPIRTSDGEGILPPDPLLPPRAARERGWVEQRVSVEALEGASLVASSQPVRVSAPGVGRVVFQSGGVMRAQSDLRRGQQYTIWSYAPRPSPKALLASPPRYPPEVSRYLELGRARLPAFSAPSRELEVARVFSDQRYQPLWAYEPVWREARRLTSTAGSPYEATVAVERWLRTTGGFAYEEQPPRPAGLPPLVDFVVRTKQGYCQHYAGAMALMLRMLGIPARVAVGFTSGTWQSGSWRVTDQQAHAWVEVWFAGHGWLTFDPTPGRGILSVAYTLASDSADAVRALGTGRFLDFTPDTTAAAPSPVGVAPGATRPGAAIAWWGVLVLGVAFVGAAAVPVAKLARRRRRLRRSEPRSLARGVHAELVATLRDHGVGVSPAAGLAELSDIVESTFGRTAPRVTDAIARARYGPLPGSTSAAVEARSQLRALHAILARRDGLTARVRASFSLASLRGP